MARAKYKMEVCENGECREIGAKSDIERAKARIAREVNRISKRVLAGKVPTGTVEGKVVDNETGSTVYKAEREYKDYTGRRAPKPKKQKASAPPPPPPEPWEDED